MFIANEVALLSPELILGYHRRWRGKGQWVLRALRAFDSKRAEQLAIALEAFYQHGTKEQLLTPAQEGLTLGGGRLFEGYASQVDAVSICATAIVRTAGALWVARALNMQKKEGEE